MNITLNGKTALVTGSTSGMGYAIARGLAESGADVVLNGRDEGRLNDAVQGLERDVPRATIRGVAADVGDAADLEQLLTSCPDVDILVSNAGPTETVPFLEISDTDWERFFQVYVMAGVRLARHYVPGMVSRGWGRIIFNASVTSGMQRGEMVHWGATKTALLGLSRGIAENVVGTGVTVNAFISGPTHTKESFMARHPDDGRSFEQIERDFFDSSLSSSLLNRFIDPREIANFVVFLASEQASALTGTAHHVDGGIIRSAL